MTFEEYKTRCEGVGRTASGLAEEFGVSRTTVSTWKSGKTVPSPATLFKLESALDSLEGSVQYRGATPKIAEEPKNLIVLMPDNSMIFDCLPKSAKITCELNAEPEEGDLVAVQINGIYTIRRFNRFGEQITLSTTNPKYPPFLLNLRAFKECFGGVAKKVEFDV